MGIDGRIFPVGTKPSDANSMFAGDWFPIQVNGLAHELRTVVNERSKGTGHGLVGVWSCVWAGVR